MKEYRRVRDPKHIKKIQNYKKIRQELRKFERIQKNLHKFEFLVLKEKVLGQWGRMWLEGG